MKKCISVFICLTTVFLLAACIPTAAPNSAPPSSAPPSVQTTQATQTAFPSGTQAQSAPAVQLPESAQAVEMVSSYAHMVSFDPNKGWAEFRTFDMLKGDDAVQWLVETKGYTQAQAEQEVSQYSDSEFIEKSTGTQPIKIDLNKVSLHLMYHPDGSMVDGPDPVQANMDDLGALYAKDSSLMLNSFFYYLKVEDGKAVSVDQVYWP